MGSSYHSPRPLLHIDLNQQIIDLDDMLMESPKAPVLTLFQSFSYSSSSSSSPSQLPCPMSINLNRDGDQEELLTQNLKEGNENLSTGDRFAMSNSTESPNLTSYNRIKLSFGREKEVSERDCTTEFSAKQSSSQKRSTRRNTSGEQQETADHHTLSSSLEQGREELPFQAANTTTDTFVRVCSDCNTTRTPLWRSGPRGPKSLCNACGIRQRKARRAMEAPEAAVVGSGGSTSTEVEDNLPNMEKKVNKKEKRAVDGLPVKKKNKFKSKGRHKKNRELKEGMFPQEEEDAAILLMALSYGLVVDSGRSR